MCYNCSALSASGTLPHHHSVCNYVNKLRGSLSIHKVSIVLCLLLYCYDGAPQLFPAQVPVTLGLGRINHLVFFFKFFLVEEELTQITAHQIFATKNSRHNLCIPARESKY